MSLPGGVARLALTPMLWLIAGAAHAAPGPSLVTDRLPAVCRAALAVATATYESHASVLYEPPVVPPDIDAAVALEPPDPSDLYETPLAVHGDIVRMVTENEGLRYYWQERAASGYRFAIKQQDIGWRGPMFSSFAVPADMAEAQFRSDVVLADLPANNRVKPVVSDSWAPPRVFVMKDGTVWLLTVGNVFEVLADWQVFVLQPEGALSVCSIAFPRQRAAPRAVRAFAQLLDSTLGSGHDEGTLQPTAHLRVSAAHSWANAVFRPWVLNGSYNSRARVDAGLKEWSRTGPSFRRVYDEIQRQYPVCEAALSQWYQRAFNLPASKASSLAAFAMDVAYRDNFTFSGGGDEPESPNPW